MHCIDTLGSKRNHTGTQGWGTYASYHYYLQSMEATVGTAYF